MKRDGREIAANREGVALVAAVDRRLVTDAFGEVLSPGDLRSPEAVRRVEISDRVGIPTRSAINGRNGPVVIDDDIVTAAAGSDRERVDALCVVDALCNRRICRQRGDGGEAGGVGACAQPQLICFVGGGHAQDVDGGVIAAVGHVDRIAGYWQSGIAERHIIGVGPAQPIERHRVGPVVEFDHVEHVAATAAGRGHRPDDLVAGRGHVDRDRIGGGHTAVDGDRRAVDAAIDQDLRGGRVGGYVISTERDGLRCLDGTAGLDREIVAGEQVHVAGNCLHSTAGLHHYILAGGTGVYRPESDVAARGGDTLDDRQQSLGRDHDILAG